MRLLDAYLSNPYDAASCQLPEACERSEWVDLLHEAMGDYEAAPWRVAYLLLYGDAQGYVDLDEVAEAYHWERHTLQNMMSVARKFPPGDNVEGLSFSHHEAVCFMDSEDKRLHWLHEALSRGWSVKRLRAELHAHASQRSDWKQQQAMVHDYFAPWLAVQLEQKAARFLTPGGVLTVESASQLRWRLE